MSDGDRPLRFEDRLRALEETVSRLEDDEVGLEEAMELFERGVGLARECRASLEAIEQRVERLLAAEDGDPSARTEPFEADGE